MLLYGKRPSVILPTYCCILCGVVHIEVRKQSSSRMPRLHTACCSFVGHCCGKPQRAVKLRHGQKFIRKVWACSCIVRVHGDQRPTVCLRVGQLRMHRFACCSTVIARCGASQSDPAQYAVVVALCGCVSCLAICGVKYHWCCHLGTWFGVLWL